METLLIETPVGTVSEIWTLVAADGPALLTLSVQLIGMPATTVAGPFLVSARSASAVTVRLTSAWLLVASGSGVSLRADAMSSMFCPCVAVIVYVSVTRPLCVVDSFARLPTLQVIFCPPVIGETLQLVGP